MLTNDDEIRAEMDVVSVDGKRLGRVAAVLSCDLKLARDEAADVPHLVPLAFIQSVDDKVRLVVTEGEARRAWREAY